jgi:hypothetical protein
MASAIVARKGPSTAVYTLRVEDSSDPRIASFTRVSGLAPVVGRNATNENILLLDYADVSDVLFGFTSTAEIADLVTPVLTTTFPTLGMVGPLAQGPIYLIGHSRGGSLVSEIARNLGEIGIWVDQVTTLDPKPVGTDPAVSLGANVIFADNYFQTQDSVVQSGPVAGAWNVGPLVLPGGYNGGGFGGLGTFHNNVHLFYQGTIDFSPSADDNNFTVNNGWYAGNNVSRVFGGFFLSRLGGGRRPVVGVGPSFGGTGARMPVTFNGTQWPNVGFVMPSAVRLAKNQTLDVRFKYQVTSFDPASVRFYLDRDRNPYNNNAVAIGSATSVGPTGPLVLTTTAADISLMNVVPAGYFLQAKISNSAATRYDYAAARITVTAPPNAPPRGLIDVLKFRQLKGWAYDPTTPTRSVVIGYRIDNKPATYVAADDDRPDLVPVIGSANHGFSIRLPALMRGQHTLKLLAVDSTSHKVTTLATRSFFAF